MCTLFIINHALPQTGVIWLTWVWRDWLISVTWLTRVWRGSFMCSLFIINPALSQTGVIWLTWVWHDSLISVTWLTSVWHVSFMCTLFIINHALSQPRQMSYMCHVSCALQHAATHCSTLQHTATHCNTLQWYDSLISVNTCHTCAMSHVHLGYDSSITYHTQLSHTTPAWEKAKLMIHRVHRFSHVTQYWVMSQLWMSHITH